MGFLDSVKSIFSGGQSADEGYWVYVRCHRCGEGIKTRLDLKRSLNPLDDGGYVVRKTLVGSNLCFERIEVTLKFDEQRRLIDHQVFRGDLITAEEFEEIQDNAT